MSQLLLLICCSCLVDGSRVTLKRPPHMLQQMRERIGRSNRRHGRGLGYPGRPTAVNGDSFFSNKSKRRANPSPPVSVASGGVKGSPN